jgi:hypothetical protein
MPELYRAVDRRRTILQYYVLKPFGKLFASRVGRLN